MEVKATHETTTNNHYLRESLGNECDMVNLKTGLGRQNTS